MQYDADLPVAVPSEADKRRLRRCAQFQWRVCPNNLEDQELRLAADRECPRACYTGELIEAWRSWHRRSEAVLRRADELGIAVCTTKAERPKGSWPSTKPTIQQSRHRLHEPVAIRTIKRLRRSLDEHRQWAGRGDMLPDE